MPKKKAPAQTNLVGQIIQAQDERLQDCIDHVKMKTTLKRVYPGLGFEIGISDKDRDKIDEISDPQKQRSFILKKMRLIASTEMAAKREGMVFQEDLDMFIKLIFDTKAAKMSKEAYEEFMAEKKEQKTEELREVAKASTKKKGGIVEDLKETFGDENVKVEA